MSNHKVKPPKKGAFFVARRRMFSSTIVENDVFLDMPLSTQALYFHLCMNADDDGFVSPKRIMRMVGANDDDLRVLIGKRYVLSFESGVVIVKHWQINNLIRKDRYHQTTYKDELKSLTTNNFGAYTEIDKITTKNPELTEGVGKTATIGKPKVNRGKVRLGKVSISKTTTNVVEAKASYGKPEINEMFEYWEQTVGYPISSQKQKNRNACNSLINRHKTEGVKRFIDWSNLTLQADYVDKDTRVTDFITMQRNLNNLYAWVKRKAGEQNKVKNRGFTVKK